MPPRGRSPGPNQGSLSANNYDVDVVVTQAHIRQYMYAARHMILKILIGMPRMRCGPMPEIQHSHRFGEFFLNLLNLFLRDLRVCIAILVADSTPACRSACSPSCSRQPSTVLATGSCRSGPDLFFDRSNPMRLRLLLVLSRP